MDDSMHQAEELLQCLIEERRCLTERDHEALLPCVERKANLITQLQTNSPTILNCFAIGMNNQGQILGLGNPIHNSGSGGGGGPGRHSRRRGR